MRRYRREAAVLLRMLGILMICGIFAAIGPQTVRASEEDELSIYYQGPKEVQVMWYDNDYCDNYTVERKGGVTGGTYDADYRLLGQKAGEGYLMTYNDEAGIALGGVYTYRVRGYKGSSVAKELVGTITVEVGQAKLRKPAAIKYSPTYIEIKAQTVDSSRCIEADVFEIWRKDLTAKQKSYKKIAEKSVKYGEITYKDKSVKKYHKYSYRIKPYVKSGSKKVYGKSSEAQTYYASAMKPSYKVKVVKAYNRTKGTVTIRLISGSGNGELTFKSGEYVLESERGSKSNSAAIVPKKYSANGKSWKKMKKSVTLKRGKSLYLQLTVPKAERKSVIKNPKTLVIQVVVSYNGVDYSSSINLLKKTAAVYQIDHDDDNDD